MTTAYIGHPGAYTYAPDRTPPPVTYSEPRACCLTCRRNTAVTATGRLRRHVDSTQPGYPTYPYCLGAWVYPVRPRKET